MHVVITGAGRGIGRGIAEMLADAGASVAVAARRGDDLDDVVATSEEVRYLVEGIARVFPSVRKSRIIGTYAGVSFARSSCNKLGVSIRFDAFVFFCLVGAANDSFASSRTCIDAVAGDLASARFVDAGRSELGGGRGDGGRIRWNHVPWFQRGPALLNRQLPAERPAGNPENAFAAIFRCFWMPAKRTS